MNSELFYPGVLSCYISITVLIWLCGTLKKAKSLDLSYKANLSLDLSYKTDLDFADRVDVDSRFL